MLRRSRVGTIPDFSRISMGVQRPGVDPRINCSLAFALKDSSIDKDHGHFVDVRLLPSELEVTCRVPQEYAGKEFGNHDGVIHADDELLVAIPEGDPALGAFVISRVWSKLYPPPALVVDNPKDTVRVGEKDRSWRLKLTGSGQWLFEGEDEVHFTNTKKSTYETETFIAKTGNVRLGDEGATEQLIKGNDYTTKETTFLTQLSTAFTTLTPAGAMLASAGAIMVIPIVGAIIAGPMVAAAGAAITAACPTAISGAGTFSGQLVGTLSTVSKTK